MKSAWKIAALAVVAVAGTGAATSVPTAIVTVKKGYDKGAGLGRATVQFYKISELNQCKKRKTIANFTWIGSSQKSKPIPSGKIMYVSALTERLTSRPVYDGSVGIFGANCENRVSFMLQSGEEYLIVQKAEIGKSCSMTVIQKSTNSAPADLVELPQLGCSS